MRHVRILAAALCLLAGTDVFSGDKDPWCRKAGDLSFSAYACGNDCGRFRTGSLNDLEKIPFTSDCKSMKAPLGAYLFVQISQPASSENGGCPAGAEQLTIRHKDDCWSARPEKGTGCQDMKSLESHKKSSAVRKNSSCRYTHTFVFTEPGRYSLNRDDTLDLLIQDSVVDINNSGSDFSVIYLKKDEGLTLKGSKRQMLQVTLHDMKGKTMFQKNMEKEPASSVSIDLRKIYGKEFMLTLVTDLRKIRKFVIVE